MFFILPHFLLNNHELYVNSVLKITGNALDGKACSIYLMRHRQAKAMLLGGKGDSEARGNVGNSLEVAFIMAPPALPPAEQDLSVCSV